MRLVLQETEEINYGASHKGRSVKNRKHAECRSISNRMSRNLGKSHTTISREIRNIRHKQLSMKNNLQEVILRKYHLDIPFLSSYIKKQYDDVPAMRRFESIYGKKLWRQ